MATSNEPTIEEQEQELTKLFQTNLEEFGQKPKLEPDELLTKMANAAYVFEYANTQMKKLKQRYLVHRQKARVLIGAKALHLLQNEALKVHLKVIFDDPKYKPTVTDVDSYVYLETIATSEPYELAKATATEAKEEYELWQGQLMWYMSVNKREGIERIAEGSIR